MDMYLLRFKPYFLIGLIFLLCPFPFYDLRFSSITFFLFLCKSIVHFLFVLTLFSKYSNTTLFLPTCFRQAVIYAQALSGRWGKVVYIFLLSFPTFYYFDVLFYFEFILCCSLWLSFLIYFLISVLAYLSDLFVNCVFLFPIDSY